jgi:hypothetical protein
MIIFSKDKDLNNALNQFLETLTDAEEPLSSAEQKFLESNVGEMIQLLPSINIPACNETLLIVLTDIKMNRMLKKKELSQKDMEIISRWNNQKTDKMKFLGLDAKSQAANRKGTLGEFIDEIVEKSEYFDDKNLLGSLSDLRKRLVTTANSTTAPKIRRDKYDALSEPQVMKELEKTA